MKIAFDAKRAAQNRTGLGNYSRFILQILYKHTDQNDYVLYIPNPKKISLLDDYMKRPPFSLCFPVSSWSKQCRSFWRSWGLTKSLTEKQINLFHGLSNELPLNIRKARGTKSIVTIHDLIFLRYPQYYKPIDRMIYNYKFKKACQYSDRIIAVSECTKKDIISYYHIAPDKIDVVYQGCDACFGSQVSAEKIKGIKEKYRIKGKFLLSVGSIESRKNLLLLAKALVYLPKDIQVVAVGKRTSYTAKIEKFLQQNRLQDRMHLLSGIPFSDLPILYQAATLFVYPSRYEGFGIPILEALKSHVPVIACTGSCLEEAGGPSSIYVSPDDEKALASAILKVWNDEDLQAKMIEDGTVYTHRFDESILCNDLLNTYRKVIRSQ